MTNDKDKLIREHLAGIGSKGGKGRAAKHSKAELSKWAKLGGRPPKAKAAKSKARQPKAGANE
jgi:hypothetical protein